MTALPDIEKDQEWRAGWRSLLASTIGFGSGLGLVTYLGGLFIRPMQMETGWSASAVTISPIISLTVALFSPAAGILVDRYGSRRISLIGLLLLAAALFLLSAMPLQRSAIYLAAAMVGLVGPLSSTTPFLRCVASWFPHRTGFALGLAMNGVPVMAFIATPIISWIIVHHGWRTGYVALGAIILLIGWPTVFAMLRERPQSRSAARSPVIAILRDIGRRPPFWTVSAAIAAASIPLGGFLANLQPMLVEGDISISLATALGMTYAVSIIIGRLGGGFLMDRLWDGGVAFGLMTLSAVGSLMLMHAGAAMPAATLAIAVLLVGMGQGAEADMIGYFALKLFGMANYSAIVGVWTMIASSFLALGSLWFAIIFDAQGSFAPACILGAGCFLLSGVLLLATRLLCRQGSETAIA